MPKSLGPGEDGVPMLLNHFGPSTGPRSIMVGTRASVSTLLMTVARAYAPALAADEDVGDVALRRDVGDGDAFEHLVRVLVDEVAVFESAGFGFVRIDREIMRPLLFLRHERPLLPGGEACAASSSEAGIGNGF